MADPFPETFSDGAAELERCSARPSTTHAPPAVRGSLRGEAPAAGRRGGACASPSDRATSRRGASRIGASSLPPLPRPTTSATPTAAGLTPATPTAAGLTPATPTTAGLTPATPTTAGLTPASAAPAAANATAATTPRRLGFFLRFFLRLFLAVWLFLQLVLLVVWLFLQLVVRLFLLVVRLFLLAVRLFLQFFLVRALLRLLVLLRSLVFVVAVVLVIAFRNLLECEPGDHRSDEVSIFVLCNVVDDLQRIVDVVDYLTPASFPGKRHALPPQLVCV